MERKFHPALFNFYRAADEPSLLKIPLAKSYVSAGFPSPAADYMETRIDLNKVLIKNPSSTFFVRVSGMSMNNAGIEENDILVVDKSLSPHNGVIAVCCLDGDFTLKRILVKNKSVWLMPENDQYKPIAVTEHNELIIWGIVTCVIKTFGSV